MAGTLMLIAVYLLPTDEMKRNAASSIDIFYTESVYPQQVQGYKTSQLDNETDAVMLLGAIYDRKPSRVLQNAMAVPHITLEGTSSFCITLKEYLWDGYEPDGEADYSRYWHGYMIWLKPLLLFMDYADIRILNMAVQIFLLMLLITELAGRKMFSCIPPLGCALVILNPVAVAMSLQFSSIYYIVVISLLIYLKSQEKIDQNLWIYFLLIGMAVAYFDFLTYPAASFCIPAGLVLTQQNGNWKEKLRALIRWGIFWAVGYGGMWAEKWLIGSLILENNIFLQAFIQMGVHSGEVTWIDGSHLGVFAALWHNIKVLLRWPYLLTFLLLAGYYCKQILEQTKAGRIKTGIWKNWLPYLFLALLPFLWMALLKSHSAWCYWYTYRNLAASGFCLCLGLGRILEMNRGNHWENDEYDAWGTKEERSIY